MHRLSNYENPNLYDTLKHSEDLYRVFRYYRIKFQKIVTSVKKQKISFGPVCLYMIFCKLKAIPQFRKNICTNRIQCTSISVFYHGFLVYKFQYAIIVRSKMVTIK